MFDVKMAKKISPVGSPEVIKGAEWQFLTSVGKSF
jgi:hypothetical protein